MLVFLAKILSFVLTLYVRNVQICIKKLPMFVKQIFVEAEWEIPRYLCCRQSID